MPPGGRWLCRRPPLQLIILPLMVGTYILFGGVAGGLYFGEFQKLHLGFAGSAAWPLYICGMLLVLIGLALIADSSAQPAFVRPEDEVVRTSVECAERKVNGASGSENSGGGKGGGGGDSEGAGQEARASGGGDGGGGEGGGGDGGGGDGTDAATWTWSSPTAVVSAAATAAIDAPASALNRVKELTVEIWSDQERRHSRVCSKSPGASQMPTPVALMYSSAKLIALRQKITSAKASLQNSPLTKSGDGSNPRLLGVDEAGPATPHAAMARDRAQPRWPVREDDAAPDSGAAGPTPVSLKSGSFS